ncbi:MAG: glycosyltransferase family 4 protein [Anaerolineae bacterium]
MNVGHVSFRLAGTDGVSLETAKLAQVLARMGHTNFYFAGELDPPGAGAGPIQAPVAGGMLIPEAHFTHPSARWITEHAFGSTQPHPELRVRLEALASLLEGALRRFIDHYHIEMLTVQNVFAIPMNLGLSVALQRVCADTGIPTIAHNHDFYWERERYAVHCVPDVLEQVFPPRLPNVHQVVINTQAQRALAARGIDSTCLPNIFDYSAPPPGPDAFNVDLRRELGLGADELFFLQPTRVIPRKGIELAIELVRRLGDPRIKLIITHHAEYDSLPYLEELLALAARAGVDLRYLPARFKPQRQPGEGIRKIYSLWDAYICADFVTYPSLYEGFGNALLETLYFRKPLLVNRYTVYREDIEPTGIQAVTLDGAVTDEAVEAVRHLLNSPRDVEQMTAHNYQVGARHFSYEAAQAKLHDILARF